MIYVQNNDECTVTNRSPVIQQKTTDSLLFLKVLVFEGVKLVMHGYNLQSGYYLWKMDSS